MAGSNSAINIPMMAMTTSNSTSVNALRCREIPSRLGIINTYRRRQTQPEFTELDGVDEFSLYKRMSDLKTSSGAGNPETEFLDGLVDSEVKDALGELPDKFRQVVLLDVEGFSYKEIAEMLDIPIGTVMSRLHRGRKFLQKRLLDLAQQRGIAAVRTPQKG